MNCHREDELLDALGRGLVGPELDAHVTACVSCSELRLVAGALLDDHREAMLHAPIPTSGTMLWRMHMRMRHDAAATARRSLLIGQAVTLAIALTLAIAFFGSDAAFGIRGVVASVRTSMPLLYAIAAWLILAPLAGWVAIRSK